MKKVIAALAFLFLLAQPALAEGEGDAWFGFGMTTSVSLFMNITSMAVNNLQPDSEAERAGVRNGQKVTAIAGCRIPGCGAREARKLFDVALGETVVFAFEREDGSTFEVPLKAMRWEVRSGASSQ